MCGLRNHPPTLSNSGNTITVNAEKNVQTISTTTHRVDPPAPYTCCKKNSGGERTRVSITKRPMDGHDVKRNTLFNVTGLGSRSSSVWSKEVGDGRSFGADCDALALLVAVAILNERLIGHGWCGFDDGTVVSQLKSLVCESMRTQSSI